MSLQTIEQIAYRSYINHFTASAVVITNGHILLVHHKRIGAWLPPGGHIDDKELPHQAAIREVMEETGILVDVLSEAMPNTLSPDAVFLPQPLCMHAVSAVEKDVTLYHLDLAYVCQPLAMGKSLPAIVKNDQVLDACWLALGDLNKIPLAANVIEIVSLAKRKLNLDNTYSFDLGRTLDLGKA